MSLKDFSKKLASGAGKLLLGTSKVFMGATYVMLGALVAGFVVGGGIAVPISLMTAGTISPWLGIPATLPALGLTSYVLGTTMKMLGERKEGGREEKPQKPSREKGIALARAGGLKLGNGLEGLSAKNHFDANAPRERKTGYDTGLPRPSDRKPDVYAGGMEK